MDGMRTCNQAAGTVLYVISVADPGSDLRGGAWTLSMGGRKSLKVLKVDGKVIFSVF